MQCISYTIHRDAGPLSLLVFVDADADGRYGRLGTVTKCPFILALQHGEMRQADARAHVCMTSKKFVVSKVDRSTSKLQHQKKRVFSQILAL